MIYTDDELDNLEGFDERESAPLAPQAQAQAMPPVPLYPLTLAQLGQQPEGSGGVLGFAKKKVGPLPVWAWALVVGGAGTGAWIYMKKRSSASATSDSDSGSKVERNASVEEESSDPGGWSPSRSSFANQLQRHFDKKGLGSAVVVWHDAEDAQKKGKLKFVSPLINIEVKDASVKADAALQKFCRREGLNPIAHSDGSIGLYPHTGKRGKAWEEYVDALRDDGQQV
jgi:hypothetical protein